MACAVEAVPRYTEADADDEDEWADDYELPEDAHWDDECLLLPGGAAVSLGEVVTELHRQAHGGPLRLCPAEPCRRLDLEQLAVIGASA